jgi:IclR family acetate operon transcriptional repressor
MNDRYVIPSLDRAFEVMELLGAEPKGLTLAELSRVSDVPKSTLFRILITLELHRCVAQDGNGRFRLSSRLWELGSHFLEQFDPYHVAASHMKNLANESGETVFLGRMDDGEVLYIRRMEAKNSVAIVKRLGQRVPAHSTATGMAILAFLPKDEVDEMVRKHGLRAYNETTVTDYTILQDRLAEIRSNGYSIVNGEYERAFLCVSAPVFDYNNLPIASVTVAMLSSHFAMDDAKLKELGETVKRNALNFSTELGWRGKT